jgi:hypothetical protein
VGRHPVFNVPAPFNPARCRGLRAKVISPQRSSEYRLGHDLLEWGFFDRFQERAKFFIRHLSFGATHRLQTAA